MCINTLPFPFVGGAWCLLTRYFRILVLCNHRFKIRNKISSDFITIQLKSPLFVLHLRLFAGILAPMCAYKYYASVHFKISYKHSQFMLMRYAIHK